MSMPSVDAREHDPHSHQPGPSRSSRSIANRRSRKEMFPWTTKRPESAGPESAHRISARAGAGSPGSANRLADYQFDRS